MSPASSAARVAVDEAGSIDPVEVGGDPLDNLDRKTMTRSRFPQECRRAESTLAEMKIIACDHRADGQSPDENVTNEILGGKGCEILVEGQDDHAGDADLGEC